MYVPSYLKSTIILDWAEQTHMTFTVFVGK